MPYVNCSECGTTNFVLAPWSAAARCPNCDAPVPVRRSRRSEQAQYRDRAAYGSDGRPSPSATGSR